MNEHEQLKEICDRIRYEYKTESDFGIKFFFSKWHWNIFISEIDIYAFYDPKRKLAIRKVNVREIIFTQELMDKI